MHAVAEEELGFCCWRLNFFAGLCCFLQMCLRTSFLQQLQHRLSSSPPATKGKRQVEVFFTYFSKLHDLRVDKQAFSSDPPNMILFVLCEGTAKDHGFLLPDSHWPCMWPPEKGWSSSHDWLPGWNPPEGTCLCSSPFWLYQHNYLL